VLVGLAVLSLVTASVAAIFVETEEREIERELLVELRRLHQEVRSLREEVRLLKNPPPLPNDGTA
jgi:voltage-gated potassium channel